MNKLSLFILVPLISFSLKVLASDSAVIVLEALNARGKLVHKEVVLIKDGSVVVNNQKLSAAEVITQSYALKQISQFSPIEKNIHCEAGTYKHIYKKAKMIKEEHGCLNNERYNELEKSFKALSADPITR